MRFTGEIIGSEDIKLRMDRMPAAIRKELVRAMQDVTLELSNTIKQQFLSGQALHVITNTLRGSISSKVSSTDQSVVGIVGTRVKYARYHEYGFHGERKGSHGTTRLAYNANPKSRKYGERISIKQALSKAKGRISLVQTMDRKTKTHGVNYAGHPFMRPALALKSSWIVMTLREAVARAMAGGK